MSKFLLLLGPSGVGKSAIIDELLKLDSRFIYISPFMTRPLRDGERNKIPVNDEEINIMWNEGKFLVVNELYDGIRYATPLSPITQALTQKCFPVLDWPVSQMSIMAKTFPNQLYSVYVFPPSIDILRERLSRDGRDSTGSRVQSACKEFEEFFSQRYDNLFDVSISCEEGKLLEIASTIYEKYLKSFN